MPKRIIGLAIALTAFGLVACNSGAPASLYGVATPTPGPTATTTPNPTATTAIVEVAVGGIATAGIPVNISTPNPSGQVGTAFATQTTNSSGQVTFTPLTAAATYCFQASYTPPTPPGSLMETQQICTNLWGVAVSPNPGVVLYF